MTKNILEQLYEQHKGKVSLKWSSYLVEYDRIFKDYRDRNISVLELGVLNGGSLEIWANYFFKAQKFIGCDIDPLCAHLTYTDPRIAVVIGDANSELAQAAIAEHSPTFGLIIDDASHRSSDIIQSFSRYFPKLENGGIYVVEDLHCSYWQEFEGGLYDPFSAISFFKRLADIINYEHWGIEKAETEPFFGFCAKYNFKIDEKALKEIHSIEFVNSMCIIRKGSNSLGLLFVAGSEEVVSTGHLCMHLREKMSLQQTANEWATRSTPPDEELLIRIQELSECYNEITALNQAVVERDRQIKALVNSRSWRITKPFRYFSEMLRKNIL